MTKPKKTRKVWVIIDELGGILGVSETKKELEFALGCGEITKRAKCEQCGPEMACRRYRATLTLGECR